jgi:uncharacterized protein (TIGR02145 family)
MNHNLKKHIMVILAAFNFLLFVSCSNDKSTDPTLQVPVLTTAAASGVTQTTADCGGIITTDWGVTVTARGVCWSTNLTPSITDNKTVDGAGVGSFTSLISGLSGGIPYYVRAYATNSNGTGYGSAIWFTTLPASNPVLSTTAVSAITLTSAECGGTITYDGAADVIARGVCWSMNPTPSVNDNSTINGEGVGNFTSSITGLIDGTTYYVRAYATNSAGTGYGSIMSFMTTHLTGSVTDIDGNTYLTVKIGPKWWMAENLKVTHYRNGNAIPNVTDASTWASLTTGAYCNYYNDSSQVTVYGCLYNWHALDDTSIIAPTGWHVASDSEWQSLVNNLSGGPVAGGKLKETGTMHWASPNTGATNESGFSALAGGYRNDSGNYYFMRECAYFWSSPEHFGNPTMFRTLYYNNSGVNRSYFGTQDGFSVRCVMD